ncbi:MAG: nucleotidyltransferase family protein, partial [Pseudomonadota bacterium]
DALLLCVSKDNAIGHSGQGDFVIDKRGRAVRAPGAIYTGLQIIKTALVEDVADTVFSLNVVWDRLIADTRLCAVTYPGQWCDVGSPAGVALAEAFLEQCVD